MTANNLGPLDSGHSFKSDDASSDIIGKAKVEDSVGLSKWPRNTRSHSVLSEIAGLS